MKTIALVANILLIVLAGISLTIDQIDWCRTFLIGSWIFASAIFIIDSIEKKKGD